MNKKQRNRKIVLQNKRNRIINRRYSSTIKTCYKLANNIIHSYKLEEESLKKEIYKVELKKIISLLYSFIDKGVKKKVLHKNTAARKKSTLGKIFTHLK